MSNVAYIIRDGAVVADDWALIPAVMTVLPFRCHRAKLLCRSMCGTRNATH